MGKSTPSPPPQPDPNVVAKAQTTSNVDTGVANSYLGNANQYGPYGSTTFAVDHYNDVNGQQVPTFNQTTTLSPEQQSQLEQNQHLTSTLTGVAQNQADLIGGEIGTPYSGPGGQPIQRSIGGSTDYSSQVGQYQDALMSKLNPSLEHDSQLLDTKLANEGYVRGTDEYARQMDLQNKNAQDARTSAILAAGQYGQQLQGMDLSQGQFANNATDQQLKQDLAIRNQPINEVSALTSGSQVSLPQTTAYQGGQVANTPIGDYYMQNAQMANSNYQQQVAAAAQQNAALYGGISNLAGMGLYGGIKKYG
jgi:hypothetical protein